MKILGKFSVFLLIVMVEETISLNSNHFDMESNAVCKVTNELYWKMIKWFYGPLKFVDVHVLTETSTTLSLNQLATLFLKEIADSKLNRIHYQFNFHSLIKINLEHFHNFIQDWMLKYRTKYWIHNLSMTTFHIRKHFRGKVKNFNADQERKDDWCIEKSEASTQIHRQLGRNAQTNQKQAFSSLLTASKSSMITLSEHHGVRFDCRDKSLSLPSPVPMNINSMRLANDC